MATSERVNLFLLLKELSNYKKQGICFVIVYSLENLLIPTLITRGVKNYFELFRGREWITG